ncbi:hypothetical protein GSS88_06995 [Corynebacterium sp. 3HC-13]|uniref:hypothetical protein n=1 Tax=Corynebacterium poyangense TaxID=2684405 RepID=UPI001CCD725F|nr:hypothetical protein [Corynebacterium poyangense]MBZ8177537.1 hypothetical protein [Corynebacterium poyangense]
MNSARSRLFPALLALALIIPLAVGAILGLKPANSWSGSGAPVDDSATPAMNGIDPAALVSARQAAGSANTQAGLLKKGTDQLKDGTQQLRDNAGKLGDGVNQAADGSQRLSQGMVEIQAGTGQLGQGATELANGIDQIVNQITGLEALRGQMLTAVDQADEELKTSIDPRSKKMRDELAGFREQIQNFQIDDNTKAQISRAQSGSRELANQLNVPGYAYHDGIYSATKGAQQLASGLGELQNGVGQAVDGVNKIDDGAGQVQNMAGQNQGRIQAVQRALPITPTVAAEEAAAAGEKPGPMLNPVHALLIAVLMGVGGVGLAFITTAAEGLSKRQQWVRRGLGGVALVLIGVVLCSILGGNLGVGELLLAGVGCALGLSTAMLLTQVAIRLLGARGAAVGAALVLLAEVAVVGYVWANSLNSEGHGVWNVIANLMPMNYTTMAISSAGNQGSVNAIVLSLGLLVVLSIIAGVIVFLSSKKDIEDYREWDSASVGRHAAGA